MITLRPPHRTNTLGPLSYAGRSYVEVRCGVVDMKALCAAVAAGTQPETLVMPNQRVLDKMATALGAELRIPGVEVVTEERVRRQSMR